jgi:hypothetical protein
LLWSFGTGGSREGGRPSRPAPEPVGGRNAIEMPRDGTQGLCFLLGLLLAFYLLVPFLELSVR